MDVIKICEIVLNRLNKISSEKSIDRSVGQLIFPNKGDVARISEQELRQMFIEVFHETCQGLYYSIETPTLGAYSFGKTQPDIKFINREIEGQETLGRSALIDMCIFEKVNDECCYNRILNIEFKYNNVVPKNFSKDVLKLMHEDQNGAFILLLGNTDAGTLLNSGEKRQGVIDKLIQSFIDHYARPGCWKGSEDKYVEIIILSLEGKNEDKKPFVMHKKIYQNDLMTLQKLGEKWDVFKLQ